MTAAAAGTGAGPPLRVPVGPEAARWTTFRFRRTVIAAARTVTSAVRLLELLPALFRDDPRVTVVFAYDPGSAFNGGVQELLTRSGCRTMPWDQLAATTPDLLVSASESLVLPDGSWPVLVLPHGVGFHKWVPGPAPDPGGPGTPGAPEGFARRLSGVVPDALLEAGRARLAISHPEQERQLLRHSPKTAGQTVLVGDPCYDRLLASRRMRARYRSALGVPDGVRLVMLSSTWGPHSLLGGDPGLPASLLAGLPRDEYRVVAAVHPNVWAAHGRWHLRVLQAAALEAGLMLLPPYAGWQAALTAADLLIGDHGSVTFYGAALGTPLLLGTFGEEHVPGTPMAELGRTAVRLDPRRGLYEQVTAALDAPGEHPSAALREIAGRAFADPGHAHAALRTVVYDLIGLPEPPGAAPPVAAYPPPAPDRGPEEQAADGLPQVSSFVVGTGLAWADGRPTVTVARHPAAVSPAEPVAGANCTHLACDDAEPDLRLVDSASVITRRHPASGTAPALRWIRAELAAHPGRRLAATAVAGGGSLTGLRDGRTVRATEPDAGLAAAVVYALLRAGLPLDGTPVTLRVGRRTSDLTLDVLPTR